MNDITTTPKVGKKVGEYCYVPQTRGYHLIDPAYVKVAGQLCPAQLCRECYRWQAVVRLFEAAEITGPDNLPDVVVMDAAFHMERFGKQVLEAARGTSEETSLT